jgi:hypothetical protein
MSDTGKTALASRYEPWLWLLTGLFSLRVMAQLSTLFVDIPYLPPFAHWHSGALPYGLLLACQLAIIALLIRTAVVFSSGRVSPVHRVGVVLLIAGVAYFALMLARLILGLTVLGDHQWFTSHIPTFFHLVLATFVLLLGKFHLTRSMECSR